MHPPFASLRSLRSIAAIMLLCALPLWSLSIDSNRITAVQIHPNGVSVERAIVVNPSEDDPGVEIVDLPARLDASSLRILVPDNSALRIGGFEFSPKERVETPLDPRTREARERLTALERQIADARDELNTLDARQKQYFEMANSVRTALATQAESSVFELGISAWETYERVKSDVETRARAINDTISELTVRRDDAQEALATTVEDLNATSGVLRFKIKGALSAPTRLVLHYQLGDAGWAPVYEVRASPAEDTVLWVYKARVWQRTGEDWNGITVSLNSASAFDPSGLPTLPSLVLDRVETHYKIDSRVRVAPSLMEPPPPAEEAAQLASTTTGFYATLPEPVSIPSGAPAAVRTAFETRLPARFWSEATPELSTNAWLVGGMTNELGWPILAGDAYFFIDGQLVSRRPLSPIAAGEEFELPLGRNENIGITRKERLRKESTAGLIDKTRRHQIRFETTVHNRMKVAHRVILRDRFPVSRNNKIQVDPESPRDVEVEEGTGLFKWERALGPDEKAVLKTEYTVTYPMEWTVYPEL